ncbi:hypothetical protein [Methylomonas rosea]|uniref:Uncharacterized protein n=1 Tax=Methylomonas rosea TaxID=2952227 RepID=A0ABT1TNS9_9GAMM|nr:hypothetical protein [Methylomonas sp. WSC-7]MCQ8116406.1 hypothetical protein [Methylomonas sp. WSC-7]
MLYTQRTTGRQTITGNWPLLAQTPQATALNGAALATEKDADKDKSTDKEVTLPKVEQTVRHRLCSRQIQRFQLRD